jgi:nicotine blue oxidoreductase
LAIMADAVAGLLLAAGAGRRYGMPKALVESRGRLQIEWTLAVLRDTGCTPVVAVLGAGAEAVLARADLTGATVVVNSDWPSGLGSSLRAGLVALQPTGVTGVAVLLVDMPGVTAVAVRRVLAHAGPDALVTATYQGQPGHPVLLGRAHWPGISELAAGDVGARPYLAAHSGELVTVACEDVADGTDRDQPTGVVTFRGREEDWSG